MTFFHSIRWRLQLWHGSILAVVLLGFGAAIWQLMLSSEYQRIDRELEQRVAAVAGAVRDGNDPFDRRPQGRPDDPPGRRPPPRGGPGIAGNDSAIYYIAWSADGREVSRSGTAPAEIPRPEHATTQRSQRMRGTMREFIFFTAQGDCVLIGRDISEEMQALTGFLWILVGAGAAVFVLGLAGGWWVSTRALRPIGAISATASKIATGDLSQRIQTPDTGSELAELAGVLNSAFARIQSGFTRQAQFTADASHELRTPVTVILTHTQSALSRERTVDEYRDSLAACERAARRMRGLIESLLTLARLDSGESAPRTTCDLAAVAHDAVELLRPLAAEHGITLHADGTAAPCHGDAAQLGQVVANLLDNAIAHSHRGGSVRVTTGGSKESAFLAVVDDGSGIDAEDLPHIFERFYRADRSRSKANGRSGLGLAISKAIVESHSGTINALSTPGMGTTVRVTLPGLSVPDATRA